MNEPSTEPPDPRLAFLRQELADDVDIDGDISPIGERWAIHGTVPLEGEVILGEYDTYDQARDALEQLSKAGRGPMSPTDPVLSTVRHDDGWLVVSFERRLGRPPDEVWNTLRSSEHREHGIPCGLTEAMPPVTEPPIVFEWCPGVDTVRWEVDVVDDGSRRRSRPGSRVRTPMSPPARAATHSCFEQLVRALDTGPDGPVFACTDITTLTTRYLAAVAAAPVVND